MKSTLKPNQFEVVTSVSMEGFSENRIFRWINLQYEGRELIPLNVKCSKKHQDAAWKVKMSRAVILTFEVNKNGSWKLIKSKLA